MRIINLTGLLAGAALALAACSAPGGGQTQDLTVQAQDLAFTPTTLEVTAGQPVRLTLQNNGTLEHDFTIMEFPMESEAQTTGGMDHDMGDMAEPELHVAAPAGQSAILEFTPTKPGAYDFWCTLAGHKEAGMTGTLTVTGP